MKILTKMFLLLICSISGYGQNLLDFKTDYAAALTNKITNSRADSLLTKHNGLLMWFYNMDPETKAYPLKEIRNEGIYQNSIGKLFADTGKSVNNLACMMAAATYDTTKRAAIINVLKHSNYKNIFAAKSLLVLDEEDISLVAKCIIANNLDEKVQYLTIDFLAVEPEFLQKFAVDSLFSRDKGMQYLAVKAMAALPPKPSNEHLLRQAVQNYDIAMKGWAIAALAHHKSKDVLLLVKPYLNNDQLKQVSWRALASSHSAKDIEYVNQAVGLRKFDSDFLNALLDADNETHLKNWLSILRKGEFPESYFFSIDDDGAIKNDKYFNDICETITNLKNEKYAYSLMRYFDGRKDSASIDFLKKCLTHPLADIKEKAKQLLND